MSAQQAELRIPTLAEAEAVIGEQASLWVARCYEIAHKLVAGGVCSGRAVYGHYRGPVASSTIFSKKARSVGFVPHGWVLLEDGRVLDPTRWVFEGVEPYIYLGEVGEAPDPLGDDLLVCYCGCVRAEHQYGGFFQSCESCGEEICGDFDPDPDENPKALEYDEGGNLYREQSLRPPPPFSADDRAAGLTLEPLVMHAVQALLGGTPEVTVPQAHWLATLPLKRLDDIAAPLFRALGEADLVGLIPLDNRRAVLGS